MLPYYILLITLSFFALLDFKNLSLKSRIILLYVSGIILVLFAGLNIGAPDRENYIDMFLQNGEGSVDFGFTILCKILSVFFDNPIYYFLTVASIAVSLNLLSFKRYSPYFLLCILFYFVHIYVLKEMIQIRAGLAGALCLFSFQYLKENQYQKYWLIMLLAISFHLASVIFCIMYFVEKKNITLEKLLKLMAICFIIGSIYPFGKLIKSLPGLEFLSRVQTYSSWGEYGESLGILTNLATVKLIIVSLLAIYFKEQASVDVKCYDKILKAYILSACWLMLWNDFAIVGARVATFLSVGEPILLASLISSFKPSSRLIAAIVFILMAYIMLEMNIAPSKVEPYIFYL